MAESQWSVLHLESGQCKLIRILSSKVRGKREVLRINGCFTEETAIDLATILNSGNGATHPRTCMLRCEVGTI